MKIRASLFLAAVALTVSCGGGGSGSSGIPEADACTQAATAACTKLYSCESTIATTLFGAQSACQSMIMTSCGATGFQCSGTTSTYHGDKAEMCKDQFNALDCDTLIQAVLPALNNNASLTGAFSAVTTTLPVCNQICTST